MRYGTELRRALSLPFLEYMDWCREYVHKAALRDPVMMDLLSSAPMTMLESIWARRYWYFQNGVEDN